MVAIFTRDSPMNGLYNTSESTLEARYARLTIHLRKNLRPRLKPVPPGFAGDAQSRRGSFSAHGLKRLPLDTGAFVDRGAGAETRRVSPSDTTMYANTHDRDGELFETEEERLRPTYVQHPRTWETGLQALKRLISRGKNATSNTSKVEPFLPDYRHGLLFSSMSSFRDVGGYLGRVGRKGSALRNRAVESSKERFLRPGALDVNRPPLDVAGRCHR